MIIQFDLDGVLADLLTPWLEAYNKDFNDTLTPQDITDWNIRKFVKPEAHKTIYKYINKENFYKNVKPVDYYRDMLYSMLDEGVEVGICTSCNNNVTMMAEKLKWIKKHLPRVDRNNIMFVNNKGRARGDVLIDDKPENIADFLKANKDAMGWLVDSPYNKESRNILFEDPRFNRSVLIERGLWN